MRKSRRKKPSHELILPVSSNGTQAQIDELKFNLHRAQIAIRNLQWDGDMLRSELKHTHDLLRIKELEKELIMAKKVKVPASKAAAAARRRESKRK